MSEKDYILIVGDPEIVAAHKDIIDLVDRGTNVMVIGHDDIPPEMHAGNSDVLLAVVHEFKNAPDLPELPDITEIVKPPMNPHVIDDPRPHPINPYKKRR